MLLRPPTRTDLPGDQEGFESKMRGIKPNRLLVGAVLAGVLGLCLSLLDYGRTDPPEWPLSQEGSAEEISLSEAWRLVEDEALARRAAVLGTHVYIEALTPAEDGGEAGVETLRAQLPFPADDIITQMVREGAIEVRVHRNHAFQASWTDRILQIAPALLILLLLGVVLLRGGAKSLGLTSSFEVIERDRLREGFDDVAGMDEARAEIEEIVAFLRDPKGAARLGGRMPKGALFHGPPGTGKTMLARAMAKEAGVPFLSIQASGVNQIFVGAGAMKVRKAFREARRRAPCIVFIDEIDAMGRARGSSSSGAGDEKETTLNALLVEMDGFEPTEGIFVVAATNRPEVLDPALTRRGRLDRRIAVSLPDQTGRHDLLEVHRRRIKADPRLDVDRLAATTLGFSGADIASLCNEAALLATREGCDFVGQGHFAAARDRILIGMSGSRRRLGEQDRRLTTVHEAGHALVAAIAPDADPIEKATIVPQGQALGFVMQRPILDRATETRDRLVSRLRVAVAGREAEVLLLGEGHASAGASGDIEAATRLARAMVAEYGMSPLGFIRIDASDPHMVDPDRPVAREVAALIEEARDWVRTTLAERRPALEALASALDERETLTGDEVREVVERA